ncbi:MAG: hypothetical protein AABX93_00670 [Nanoarchaeota archaeon]
MKNSLLVLSLLLIVFGFSGFAKADDSNSSDGNIVSVRIIDFESPVRLGDFLNFKYYLRGISDTENMVIVDFWIERDGNKISSGSDSFYLSDISNGTANSKIFLPSAIESGIYRLNLQVTHKDFVGTSYRTIEIVVRNGFATIDSGNNPPPKSNSSNLVVISLILLALLNIIFMYYFEKEKINLAFAQEETLIKKYRLSIFTVSFFIILGVLVYYLDSIGKMSKIFIYAFYLFLIILFVSIFVGRRISKREGTSLAITHTHREKNKNIAPEEKNIRESRIVAINKKQKTEKISPEWWETHLGKINDWLQQDINFGSKNEKSPVKNEKISRKNPLSTKENKKNSASG